MAAIAAFQLGNMDSPKDAPDATAVLALSSSIALPVLHDTHVWLPAPATPLDFGLGGGDSGGGGDGAAVGYAG